MSLKQDTTKLVNQVFEDVYGYKPSKIRDFIGNPPGEKNSYLFNAMLSQYEGIVTGKSSVDYIFFIFFNPKSNNWEYDITPIGKAN